MALLARVALVSAVQVVISEGLVQAEHTCSIAAVQVGGDAPCAIAQYGSPGSCCYSCAALVAQVVTGDLAGAVVADRLQFAAGPGPAGEFVLGVAGDGAEQWQGCAVGVDGDAADPLI